MNQVLTLSGDQTIYQAAQLHQTLSDILAQHQGVELDLSQIGEFDCAAAQILLWLTREGARLQLPIALKHPASSVQELVALLGLGGSLTFTEASV